MVGLLFLFLFHNSRILMRVLILLLSRDVFVSRFLQTHKFPFARVVKYDKFLLFLPDILNVIFHEKSDIPLVGPLR